MFRYGLHYGGILGASSFAMFLIIYLTGNNPLGNASWLGAWIPAVVIAVAVKSYRTHEGEGFISYGEGFRTGLITALLGGVLSALLIYIFCTLFDSTLVERFKADSLAQLELMEGQFKSMLSDKMYDQAVDAYNNIDLQSIAMNDFFNKLLSGIILSLIIAAVYKRNKPQILE